MFFRRDQLRIVYVLFFILSVTTLHYSEAQLSDNWYHYEQGMRMIEAKNWDQALKEFNYYLNHPEMHRHMFGVAYFGRGLLFQAMGKYDEAITEFRVAIKNDLHSSFSIADNAYVNIGNIYFKNKEYQESIMAYSKAVEINPNNGLAHYYLGLSYLRAGEYDKAEKEAERAKKLGVPFTALKDELNKMKNSSSKEQDTLPDKENNDKNKQSTNNPKAKKSN